MSGICGAALGWVAPPLAHWTLASRAGFGVELAQDWLRSAPLPASVISFSRGCAQLSSLRSISERAADLPTLTDTHSSQTAALSTNSPLFLFFFYSSNKTRKRIKETGTKKIHPLLNIITNHHSFITLTSSGFD